ncbi:MAG: hypothetical protein ACI9IP_002225 [Arcticibacterium sp.]|jgi:hypothetical protein
MKLFTLFLILIGTSSSVLSQSILLEPQGQSINGKTEGINQLDINNGGLLIQTKHEEDTLSEQTESFTMDCSTENHSFSSSGVLTDPSGFGSYSPLTNYDCTYRIVGTSDSSFNAFRIRILMLDTDAVGDSIILEDYSTGEVYFRFSGNTAPAEDIFFPTSVIRVRFKTDADRNIGMGFKLFWSEMLQGDVENNIGFKGGNVFLFDAKKAALIAGRNSKLNFENAGFNSIAMGDMSRATGKESIALGSQNKSMGEGAIVIGEKSEASGKQSLALGYFSKADGYKSVAINTGRAGGERSFALGYLASADSAYTIAIGSNAESLAQSSISIGNATSSGMFSIAIGHGSNASAQRAVALGYGAIAGGSSSIALGGETTGSGAIAIGNSSKASGQGSFTLCSYCEASGDHSTSMGNKMYTNGKSGTFMIGDEGLGATAHYANVSNRMITRFRNGYYFYTDAANTIGVKLLAGDNSWSTASDSTLKENFLPSIGEKVLNSVAKMRVGTWNYKTQDSGEYRHWGVMAQDFYKHFGQDKYGTVGSDTLIASADFDGVSFAAIKALEERTRGLNKQLVAGKEQRQALDIQLKELKAMSNKQQELLAHLIERFGKSNIEVPPKK